MKIRINFIRGQIGEYFCDKEVLFIQSYEHTD